MDDFSVRYFSQGPKPFDTAPAIDYPFTLRERAFLHSENEARVRQFTLNNLEESQRLTEEMLSISKAARQELKETEQTSLKPQCSKQPEKTLRYERQIPPHNDDKAYDSSIMGFISWSVASVISYLYPSNP